MDINRNNYEAYFLDYVEGNLSTEDQEVLQRFLRFNPDLEAELKSFSLETVNPGEIRYPDKKALKISFPEQEEQVDEDNFDMQCVAYLEGDLSHEQRQAFEIFLTENPDYEKQFSFFKSSYLQMEQVTFPSKEALYRRTPLRINWNIFVPVAAAAAMALLVFLGPREEIPSLEVAGITEPERSEILNLSDDNKEETPDKPVPVSLKVVKRKKSPVPVTNYEPTRNKGEKTKTTTEQVKKPVRLAGLSLERAKIKEIPTRQDRIEMQAIEAPKVHYSSFTVRELAEYQIKRVTELAENDDEVLFSLASAGVKELSKLTGNEAKLLASRDDDGDISGIHFKSRVFNISTPLSQEESE